MLRRRGDFKQTLLIICADESPSSWQNSLPSCLARTVIDASRPPLAPPLPRIVQFSSGLFYSTSLNDEYTESKTGLLPEPRCLLSADALKKHLHCVCPWKWGLFARSGECLCIAQSPRKSGMRKYCELRVSSRLVSSLVSRLSLSGVGCFPSSGELE